MCVKYNPSLNNVLNNSFITVIFLQISCHLLKFYFKLLILYIYNNCMNMFINRDKPDSKHELVLEPMKIEIKKIIPVAVPAPTISSTIPLISQLNHSTSSVTSSLLRTTKNTSRDSINTPISSPDYSSDSEPTPPIKVIKKRPLKKVYIYNNNI